MDYEDKALAETLSADVRKKRDSIANSVLTGALEDREYRFKSGQIKAYNDVLTMVQDRLRKQEAA